MVAETLKTERNYIRNIRGLLEMYFNPLVEASYKGEWREAEGRGACTGQLREGSMQQTFGSAGGGAASNTCKKPRQDLVFTRCSCFCVLFCAVVPPRTSLAEIKHETPPLCVCARATCEHYRHGRHRENILESRGHPHH